MCWVQFHNQKKSKKYGTHPFSQNPLQSASAVTVSQSECCHSQSVRVPSQSVSQSAGLGLCIFGPFSGRLHLANSLDFGRLVYLGRKSRQEGCQRDGNRQARSQPSNPANSIFALFWGCSPPQNQAWIVFKQLSNLISSPKTFLLRLMLGTSSGARWHRITLRRRAPKT